MQLPYQKNHQTGIDEDRISILDAISGLSDDWSLEIIDLGLSYSNEEVRLAAKKARDGI
ncbi:MAG: hypothetical protein JW779_14360 [Candidatus Thorarchaeota archaeon]|nr:hypothetical protein [Candidatus Thorarchaeota archaeon]